MNDDVVVQGRGVARRWGESSGLEPTDFVLRAHELTVVRGRSGTGKSTLLALVAGWCDADHGELVRTGAWASREGWMRWTGIAVMPQVIALVSELTVAENLSLPLRLAGLPMAECGPRVEAVLARLDLVELRHRLPSEVSMGQRQRVGVGRVAVAPPAVALVDEPTSHQGAVHAELVVEQLRALADGGTAVLVATHDPVVVRRADHVIDLDRDE